MRSISPAPRSASSWSPRAATFSPPTGGVSVVSFSTPPLSLLLTRRTRRILCVPKSSSFQTPPPPLVESAAHGRRWKKVLRQTGPSSKAGLPQDGEATLPPAINAEISSAELDLVPLPRRQRPLWKKIFWPSKKVRNIVLLNVLTVIYASNISVVKEVQVTMDPSLFTVVRFALAAIPFIPFVLRACGDRQTLAVGTELGLWVSLGYLFQALGLLTSDAARASFISAFTVIVVPLMDGMFGAAVPTYTWFGAIVSLVGVAMLECSGSPPCGGDILNLLSAVCFGIHMLRTEHVSRSAKKENFLALLGYEVCVVAFLSTIWFILRGTFNYANQLSMGSWSWTILCDWFVSFPWIPALYTGIFSTGLCLWAELAAMCNVSATETAIIYGLEPVWGAAFAWFFLGERWGVTGWIGAALVLGGSLTVQILGSLPKKSG